MRGVKFPDGWRVETLARSHQRRSFDSGNEQVNVWLRSGALQAQKKKLSVTKVLLNESGTLIGFYTLATGQVDFSDLPADMSRKMPKRKLPVAILGWLGVDQRFQGSGLGLRLLATALRDCHDAGRTFSFVAVILDCVDSETKSFYERFDFQDLPGYPMRLYLSAARLDKMLKP